MLLRLLPAPTATQSSPPTILFTLPLPTQPYTARSLPLPPNFLAHRSVCLQEDIECPNVLLGDKASWITGIIDDVTFSLVTLQVTVNYIDGTTSTYAIEPVCAERLHRVCREVQLSFAPSPPPSPETTPAHSRSSSSSSSTSSSGRPPVAIPSVKRSPSSLLFSLLSPLLPNSASTIMTPRIPPARVHRRQARSLLVDTFRRFVLPALKAEMPAAYLPWAVNSESKRRMAEFEKLQAEVDEILFETGVEKGSRVPLKRYRTFSSGEDSAEDAESEGSVSCFASRSGSASSLVTPATSLRSDCSTSSDSVPSPQSFLLSIPPAHALPLSYQPAYTVLLQRLTHIASRLHAVKRLGARYEKEESKRVWLEEVERSRAGDKALRRAMSSGELKPAGCGMAVEPTKRTKLWRSWTSEDQEQLEEAELARRHPCLANEDEPDMIEDTDDADVSEDDLSPVTPSSSRFDHRVPSIHLPPCLETCYEAEIEAFTMATAKVHRRPSLERSQPIPTSNTVAAPIASDDEVSDGESEESDENLPSLSASSSTESLSSGDWDDEIRTPSPPLAEAQEQLAGSSSLPDNKTNGYSWTNPFHVDVDGTIADIDAAQKVRPQSRLGFRRVSAAASAIA